MSRNVKVEFEVKSMAIMKNTLTQMGIDFKEKNQDVIVDRRYHPIAISGTSGSISYDSDNEREVDSIKQSYMLNFWKDRAIREGMQLKQEVKNGEIHLTLTHM